MRRYRNPTEQQGGPQITESVEVAEGTIDEEGVMTFDNPDQAVEFLENKLEDKTGIDHPVGCPCDDCLLKSIIDETDDEVQSPIENTEINSDEEAEKDISTV